VGCFTLVATLHWGITIKEDPTMNRMFKRVCAGVVTPVMLGVLASLGGCSGTTSQGVAYTLKPDRELEGFVAANLVDAHEAAKTVVINQFKYRIIKHAVDAREGTVEALSAKGDTVRVETYYASPRVTRVEVFVGPMGDEPIMKDILNAISQEADKRTRTGRSTPATRSTPSAATPSTTAPSAAPSSGASGGAKPAGSSKPATQAAPAGQTTPAAPR
jgi:hypothetical protein